MEAYGAAAVTMVRIMELGGRKFAYKTKYLRIQNCIYATTIHNSED